MLKRIILYAVYIILVAGLIVAIVLAFRTSKLSEPTSHNTHGSSQSAKTPVGGSPKQPSSTPSSNAPASGSVATPGSSSVPSGKSSQTGSSQLTNTGPGEVWAVFAAGTLAGTLVFRRYQQRKLS